jgi:hypothetical protein
MPKGTRTPFTGLVLENAPSAAPSKVVARIRIAAGTDLEAAAKLVANAFKKLAGDDNTVTVTETVTEKAKDGTETSKEVQKQVTLKTCEGIINLH